MNQANICAFFHKTILNYIFGCQLNSLFRTNHPQPIGCAQVICDDIALNTRQISLILNLSLLMGNCVGAAYKRPIKPKGPTQALKIDRNTPKLKSDTSKGYSTAEICSNFSPLDQKTNMKQIANQLQFTQNGLSREQALDETEGQTKNKRLEQIDTLVKTQRQKLNNSIVKIDYPKQSNNLNESKISQINAKLTALEVPVFDQKYMLSRRKVQNTQVVSWMGNTKDRQMDKTSETQANLKLHQIGMPVREQLQLPDYNLVASSSNEGPDNIPTSANPYIDRSLIVQSIRKVDQNKFTQTQQNITKNSTQQALQIIPISLFKEPSQLQDEKINEQPDEYPILGLIWQSKIMMK